jgi:hypothetical protein
MAFRWEENEGEVENWRGRRGDHEEVLTGGRETVRKEIRDGDALAAALGSVAAALRARRGGEVAQKE